MSIIFVEGPNRADSTSPEFSYSLRVITPTWMAMLTDEFFGQLEWSSLAQKRGDQPVLVSLNEAVEVFNRRPLLYERQQAYFI